MLRIVSVLVGMLTATGVTVGVAPAAHAASWFVDTGKPCNWRTYKTHDTVAIASKGPVLTHVQTFGMPPSASHTVTKTVEHATTLSATVGYNAKLSISSSGAARIIGKASAEVGFSLKASGSHTTRTSTKVTDTISNRTRHNANFVFYAGYTRVHGRFRHYFCEQTHPYSRWTVRYSPGKWHSYGVYGDGAVRCGAGGTLNTLQKLALRVGCA